MASPVYNPQAMPAIFWGNLDQKQKEACLEMVAQEIKPIFDRMVEAVIFATGLRSQGGAEALRRYEQRTPDEWAHLQATMPHEYDRQFKDWGQKLAVETRKPKKSVIFNNESKVARDIGNQLEAN